MSPETTEIIPTPTHEPLKYLFEVHFTDGTIYSQTPDDVSQTTPGKNAFYDILQRLDEVMIFGFYNADWETNTHSTFLVDLRDGHFEINQVPLSFNYSHGNIPVMNNAHFRLVYFKRHTHTTGHLGQTHTIEYHLGWQCTYEGKNYQFTLGIN